MNNRVNFEYVWDHNSRTKLRIKQEIKGYVDLLRKALEKFLYSYALTAYLLRKKN